MSEQNDYVQVVGGNGEGVSLQVYQDIYNSITGKTEVVTRMFFDAHQVCLADLERLHREFEIQLEQYNCKVTNCHVSVRYCNGKSEGFSGFNRFRLDGVNKSVATESIDVEYDFVILLPKTNEAKPYKLIVGVRSTLGVVHRMDETNATETERSLFYGLDNGTARLELHYVDLAVARTLEALVEDWYKSLRKRGNKARLKALESAVSVLPVISRLTVIASTAVLAFLLLYPSVVSIESLFTVGLIAGTALMMAVVISIPLAVFIRNQVLRAKLHSTIELGRADEQLISKQNSNTLKRVAFAFAGWMGAVGASLIATYAASLFGL